MMDDVISRQMTIEHLQKRLYETALNNVGVQALCDSIFADTADNRIPVWVNEIASLGQTAPSAEPKIIRCKDCKHRPEKVEESDEYDMDTDLEFPDNVCPCQCEDFWYSWMPEDDWFCKDGERKE